MTTLLQGERREGFVDLYRQVVDHAVIDCDDFMCGVVDDLEIQGGVGEPLRVTALLIGPGAWVPRLPAVLARLLPHLVGRRCVRVPWEEVSVVGEHIRLRCRRQNFGLGTWDRKLALKIGRLPHADRPVR